MEALETRQGNYENDLIDFLVEECGVILKVNECEDCGDRMTEEETKYVDRDGAPPQSWMSATKELCGDCMGCDFNLEEGCDLEQPIVEDGFRTNNECVCEKKPDNDYPCLCDEVDEDYDCYNCGIETNGTDNYKNHEDKTIYICGGCDE